MPEPLCVPKLDQLYTCTGDVGAALTRPVQRPRPGESQILWYIDVQPFTYAPYLVRVLHRDDRTLKFVFLHGQTGDDLTLSRSEYTVSYLDSREAHPELPSTATIVTPGSAEDCGLLFLNENYVKSLPKADRDALVAARGGDGKWPYAAGRNLARQLVDRVRTLTTGKLTEHEHNEITTLLERLELAVP